MWYFIWIIGVLAACGFAIYQTLRLEKAEPVDNE